MPTKPRPTRAPSAAPLHCPKIWADARAIYLELGDGTVISFARSAAGLGKAVTLIAGQPFDFGGAIQGKPLARPETLSEAHAESVLRRMGIIR